MYRFINKNKGGEIIPQVPEIVVKFLHFLNNK